MQRVNQAYEKRHLLDLLSIQIEIEQIDTSNLANASNERIDHYNQVLRDQLAELEGEVATTTAPYRAMLGLSPWQTKLEPALVDAGLTRDVQQIKMMLNELRADLVALRDPARLREFLKHVEFDDGAGDYDDIEDLALLFSTLEDSAGAGRRRRRRR
ncbi:MAG: hypothetical protein HY017_13355 [Betaproteobacteria bacterium]|nr:hypothetical protein [Betaproteobacteria bacterium]